MNKLLLLILPATIYGTEANVVNLSLLKGPQKKYENKLAQLLMIKARECRLKSQSPEDLRFCAVEPLLDYISVSQLDDSVKNQVVAGALGNEMLMLTDNQSPESEEHRAIKRCIDSNRTEKEQKACIGLLKFFMLSSDFVEAIRRNDNMIKQQHEEYNKQKKQQEAHAKKRN